MTGKERFRAAFAHEPVDRVPLMEQSVASTVASELLSRPALTGTTDLHHDQAEAAVKGDAAYDEFIETVLQDTVALAERLGHDAVSVPWLLGKPAKKLNNIEFLYGDPDSGPWSIRRYDPESRSFGIREEGGGPRDENDLRRHLDAMEATLRESSGTTPMYPRHERLMELVGDRLDVVGGTGIAIPLNEVWLTAVGLWPDIVERYLDMGVAGALRALDAQAALGIRVIWGGYDLADNRGPIYGPRVFREMVMPRIRRLTDRCRELGLYYLFRTDGNLWSIADEFYVESGIHAHGEIDVDAGMDLVEIRRRYPEITMWGGIACGTLLQHGTADAVRTEVRRVIDGVGTSGLIFGSSNSILHGTPVENVLAMVDEVNRASAGATCS
jgi:Uroporphyrinogen decarboxylase (URO-D)